MPGSDQYCFEGIPKGPIVAVGMIGCKKNKSIFLRGYNTMLERIQPEAVPCFGAPYPEMQGTVIPIDYRASRKVVR